MSSSFTSLRRLVQSGAMLTACFFGVGSHPGIAAAPGGQPGHQAPAASSAVIVAPGARDAYFALLRLFAEKYGFAIRIAQTTPSGEDFVVQLFREDIKAIATNALTGNNFSLYFFSSCAEEADANTRQDVATMVADLKAMLATSHGLEFDPGKSNP